MAYQKRNFKKDQLLMADDLNKMDNQIALNEESAKKANEDIKNKLDKSAVVQEKGNSKTTVMSQEAATREFNKLSEDIDNETKNRQNAVAQESAARNASIAQERNRAIARENEIEELFSLPTQEAVDKWLDEHPEATTTVRDKSLTIDKMVVGALGYVTPEMFGAKGDGMTDDTIAVQTALDRKGVVVFDPNSNYLITTSIEVRSNTLVRGNNAKITTNDSICMVSVKDSVNIIITDLNIVNVKSDAAINYAYCLRIAGSQNVTIDNVKVGNTYSDGIYIGYTWSSIGMFETKNIVVRNCTVDDAGRNSVTISSGIDVLIENCLFTGANYADPKAGIDFECENGTDNVLKLNNIIIRNCRFSDSYYAFKFYINDRISEKGSITIKNCIVDDTSASLLYNDTGEIGCDVVVDGYRIGQTEISPIIFDNLSDKSNVVLKNIIAVNTRFAVDQGLITIDADKRTENFGTINISGVTISNCNFRYVLKNTTNPVVMEYPTISNSTITSVYNVPSDVILSCKLDRYTRKVGCVDSWKRIVKIPFSNTGLRIHLDVAKTYTVNVPDVISCDIVLSNFSAVHRTINTENLHTIKDIRVVRYGGYVCIDMKCGITEGEANISATAFSSDGGYIDSYMVDSEEVEFDHTYIENILA